MMYMEKAILGKIQPSHYEHLEQFLADICAGGYKKDGVKCDAYKIQEAGNVLHGVITDGKMFWIDATVLLDPLAWQVAAKIRGWDDLDMDEHDPLTRFHWLGWLEKWHQFINLRSDGMTVNDALGQI